jgi:hypothetical protein
MSRFRYGSFFRETLRKEVLEAGWTRCIWCGGQISKRSFTVEHVVPRGAGGNDDPGNLAAAHQLCNSRRGLAHVKPSATVLKWALEARVLDMRAERYLQEAEERMDFHSPL